MIFYVGFLLICYDILEFFTGEHVDLLTFAIMPIV